MNSIVACGARAHPTGVTEASVVHNAAESRFELALDGQIAVLEYYLDGSAIVFTHTGVPPGFEGRGNGAKLAAAGLEYARSRGLRIVPRCTFIAAYLRRHPEYRSEGGGE